MLNLIPHICISSSFELGGSKNTSVGINSKDTITKMHHFGIRLKLSTMSSIETNISGSSIRVIKISVRVNHIQIYTCTCAKSGCEDKGNHSNSCILV